MIRSERRRVEEGWWGESGIKDTPIKYINVISDMAVKYRSYSMGFSACGECVMINRAGIVIAKLKSFDYFFKYLFCSFLFSGGGIQ